MTWKVLIADDRDRVRSALTQIIATDPEFRVVGEATDGAQAATLCEALRPDLVLMDVVMRPVDGIEGTRLVGQRSPGTKVLALTSFAHPEWLLRMLQAGACGYLAKEGTPDELFHGMRTVLAGDDRYAFTPDMISMLVRSAAGAPAPSAPMGPPVGQILTDRELELVGLLARGCNNRLIARGMGITENSAKVALSRIMAKLGVRDRVQVLIRCHQLGLVDLRLVDTELFR